MPQKPVSDRELERTIRTFAELRQFGPTARKLMLSESSVKNRLVRAIPPFGEKYGVGFDALPQSMLRRHGVVAEGRTAQKAREFEVAAVPDEDIDVEELVQIRKRQFSKKRAHEEARKLIPVKVKIPGPIGILHFGDPHVDDDGTDIGLLEHHKALCMATDGLFAANVGDITNNWVGRLAKLYDSQSTSAKQAWKLAEWLLKDLKLLYLIGGNHDGWSGAGDPLKWIAGQTDSLYQSSECRLALNFPNGRQVRVNARHDFAGHSQWNPAHGPMKAVLMGARDHISVCGHKHKTGYGIVKDPNTEIACHAFQIASYKIFDRYARERGFRDQSLGPCVLTVINIDLPDTHPDLVKPFWNADEGVDYLKHLRRKARA